MTLFDDPAVIKTVADAAGPIRYEDSYESPYEIIRDALPAALAALDREELIEEATTHFEQADDFLSLRGVCRGRAVGLLVDLGLIEEEG